MKIRLSLFVLLMFLVWLTRAQSASFTSDAPQCDGNTVHFFPGNPGGDILYETWDFGDGTTLDITSGPFPYFATHLYANYGGYLVTRWVHFTTGTVFDYLVVEIRPKPVADFYYFTMGCAGEAVDFIDNSSIPTGMSLYIVQWIWDFGDGTPPLLVAFPSSSSVSHLFVGAALTHNVTLTVVLNNGCSNTFSQVVTLNPSPIADFTWSMVTCTNDSVQFYDLSQGNGGTITSYFWSFEDPASGANSISQLQNPVHAFSSPGVYMVMEIVQNPPNCSNTMVKAVVIPAQQAGLPSMTIPMGKDTCFADVQSLTAGGCGNTFGVLSGGSAKMVTGHTVSLLNGVFLHDGCSFHAWITTNSIYCPGDQPAGWVATSVSGTQHTGPEAQYRIWPNPTTDRVYIEPASDQKTGAITVECYSSLGIRVAKGQSEQTGPAVLDLTGNPPGIYLIHVTAASQMVKKKILLSPR